uniref:Uncharacterized protein n=1 Tax=Glossina brevipalpis TaxID=37001 RepID=A0A1A9WFT0_9MUSC
MSPQLSSTTLHVLDFRKQMSTEVSTPPRGHLISAIISCIMTLMIYATLRFYSEWFNKTQLNTIFGGFIGSWLFLFSLTSLSNVEMLLFGEDFSSKFIPEILFCLVVAVVAAGVVHRVCATTCILFSMLGLYFVDRISNAYYNKSAALAVEPMHSRKSNKKNK